MPPLLDRQQAGVTLGAIRLGVKIKGADGKERPARLDTFRFTSAVKERIDAAAELYGGRVEPWQRREGMSPEWQVVTERSSIPVTIPPGDSVQQDYMLFAGRPVVRQRLCDGFNERLRGVPCQCPSDLMIRSQEAARGNACKPTTIVRLILADIPGVGLWTVTSRGDSAADELGRTAMLLQEHSSQGIYLPAALRIDQRRTVGSGEVHQYAVPVLDVGVALADLAAGNALSGLASSRGEQRALEAKVPVVAPEGPAFVTSQALAEYAARLSDPRVVWGLGKVAEERGWLEDVVWFGDVGESLGSWLQERAQILNAEQTDGAPS